MSEMVDDWEPIRAAGTWDPNRAGQQLVRLRDSEGREFLGKRTLWNNSGWREDQTNREIFPTEWRPLTGGEKASR